MGVILKTPTRTNGYASKDKGLGEMFFSSLNKCRSLYLNHVTSYIKSGVADRKNEVNKINKVYNEARESIAQDFLNYLLKNDGVVDAWPDPDTGISLGFKLSEDNDEDASISYDTYCYEFDYFGSDYESNKYGRISGGGRTYRNPYKYKDTLRMRNIKIRESNLLDDFKENNPLKFGWSLLVIFLIIMCFIGPVLSTAYLFFLQRAADPEVVELAVEAFAGKFSWILDAIDKAPVFITIILIVLLLIPAIVVLLLKMIPEMVCALAGNSVIVLIVYGAMLFVGGFMVFGMIYAFIGEKIPSAKPIEGIKSLISYIESKFSQERKEAHEENERLRAEYTELMEDFHSQWYNYVSRH